MSPLAKEEAAVNAHASDPAAGQRQCPLRVSPAIDQPPPAPDELRLGRFSTGIEQRPDASRKLRLGRFSNGIEQRPDASRGLRLGRFSNGIEQRPDAPGTLRAGSFADGYAAGVISPPAALIRGPASAEVVAPARPSRRLGAAFVRRRLLTRVRRDDVEDP
jgi:hypothetical protein